MKKIITPVSFISPKINHKEVGLIIKESLKAGLPNEGYLTKIFEKKISKIINVKHVIATTSGTISLFLALKSLDVKDKDEVLIPNITFAATANAVTLTGAKPVLVDVNKDNILIDINQLKKKISKKTKAIIAVHVSGRGSNIEELKKISKKYKIKLIEDAAEAFISKSHKKYLGTFGDLGCFSFSPPKIITTGQGGVIVTNNTKLFKKILRIKESRKSWFF
jgi:perosamine synthetase